MIEIDRDFCRKMTEYSLDKELNKIKYYYMKVYDEYYSDNGNRDSAFLKDLVDSIIGISAILEVYVEHNGIHSDYALEKLESSKSYINAAISYYENKKENNNENR